MLHKTSLSKLAKSSFVRSAGIKRTTSLRIKDKEELDYEDRKNRHEKTPTDKRIPGLDIGKLTTEQLEFYLSLKLDAHPLTKNWKIKAAHELAARYIEGNTRKEGEKAPQDQVKAYEYAEKEINCYSIEELEEYFFLIEVAGKKVGIAKNWLQNRKTSFNLDNNAEIDKLLDQAKWNGHLKEGTARNANAILLAWEKQLIATRLAKHYRELKKEKRDAESVLLAKFYKRLVHHLKAHELPDSKISLALKKISPRFNQIRLLLSRIGKIFSVINGSLPPFIRWLFAALSLYFLIELIIDIAVLIKEGPRAFWEDNRPSRMANSSFWFPVNLACLVLALLVIAGPVAIATGAFWIGLLTVVGCGFDVIQEIGIGMYSYKVIKEQLANIDAELKNYADIDVNKEFTRKEKLENPEAVAKALELIAKKQALLEIREQIIKRRNEVDFNRAYVITIMTVLFVAAAFICFPPLGALLSSLLLPAALAATVAPWVPLIASGIALVVGSGFGGIGRFLYLNGGDIFNSIKEKLGHTYTAIQKWCGLKVKSKFAAGAAYDDWQVDYKKNTAEIKEQLMVTHPILSNLSSSTESHTPMTSPKVLKNYILHRSPSGTLFTTVNTIMDAEIAPPAVTTPNNPRTV